MDSNFASIDSLIPDMQDYFQDNNPENSLQNSLNAHDVTGGRYPIFSDLQGDDYGFTNTFILPASPSRRLDQTYAFHGHHHNQHQHELPSHYSLQQQHYQYHEIEHPGPELHSNFNAPYLTSGNGVPPLENRFNSMNLSNSFDQYNSHNHLHRLVPPMMVRPQAPQATRFWTGEPYARLIYEALRKAPGHRMVLRDIYKWFEQHTDKPQMSNSTGWKNSIRHNLSMNAAFQKVEARNDTDDGKKTYIWALSAHALAAKGVESTTRYRKNVAKKTATPESQYRVSKSGLVQHTANTFQNQRSLTFEQVQKTDMVNVKSERNSLDLSTFPQGSADTTWLGQNYDTNPQLTLTQNPIPLEGNCPRASFLSNDLPSFAALAPPLDYEHNDHYATHRNTPEQEMRQRNSPTPSMTTAQSSFGFYDDTDFDPHHQSGKHIPTGHHNGHPPSKEFGQTYPSIYQEDDVTAFMERLS